MINFNSTTQLSLLFFGGTTKEDCQVPILNELGQPEVYKSGVNRGKEKTKKGTREVSIKGLGLKPHKSWETKKKGTYQTNEAVLKIIALKDNEAGQIAKLMLKAREREKLIGTYYEGFEKFVHTDSCVHANINLVQTETGRTSSNKPNIQNVPRG